MSEEIEFNPRPPERWEAITIERLNNYTEIVKELDFLLKQKQSLIDKIGTLKSVDFSKIKVTSGNGQKLSEQERFAITLEKINKKIDEYKAWLPPEHSIIKAQFSRIKRWEYRKLLVLRYLEKWKWNEIIDEFFSFEADFEEEKELKYKDTVMRWHRQALADLEKISAKPYEPAYPKQMTFESGLKVKVLPPE